MNSNFPLVSVFVASYNNARYIQQSLESVRQQTYPSIELIIVDDASTDSSVEVIREWLTQTGYEAKFIINETNLGVCKSSNVFLSHATGTYISWLASDDIMLPQKLDTQVTLLENSPQKVGVVYSDAVVIGADSKQYFSRFIQMHRQFVDVPQGYIFPVLLQDNYIPVMTALFRRSCFDECGWYDEDLNYEDWDILLRFARKFEFIYSDYVAAQYRVHSASLSQKLQSLTSLESSFKLLYKHIAINAECDAIIKGKLRHLLDRMYYLKSPRQREYMEKYYAYFNDEWLFKFALKSGLPYFRLLRIQRLLGRFTGKA
ncbi:glycosyltransferase [Hymenobacter monticola]|uniref:Glycosyltransferase n=1 Tax=Hymenobacter monticola TaxID=1705399 RepID=A0ABY4AYR7_9BACT|nr:glycosyltransferase [Hymenobacter monticola]UOE31845.1 glycosyltransferase [Hymenobacter monticola]